MGLKDRDQKSSCKNLPPQLVVPAGNGQEVPVKK